MINSRADLKKCLELDYRYYKRQFKISCRDALTLEHLVLIKKYIKYLRYEEYYLNKNNKIFRLLYTRKKNKLGNMLGFYILPNTIDSGLTICHHGSIIINGNSKIGKNCKFHGDNCVGNNGKDNKAPTIGDDVDIGVGAKIIGDVYIADGTKIGANAVVTKSCYDKNSTLVGIPARGVKK